jgi:hypothetical protein
MSDNQQPGPIEWRQRHSDSIETIETHLDGRQAQIHTAQPGHIVSYDPTTMTATVQLGLQALHQKIDGSIEPVTIHPVSDVPVHFPGGGGHTMTFPIKPGDECLVIFAERNIDAWHQHGGTQKPLDYRMHDVNDCFAMVGLRSQPKVLANVSADTVQLRSDDGKSFIDLDGAGGKVTMKTAAEIVLDCPLVTVTGRIEALGEVTARAGASHVNLSTHHHSGNNAPPTPGTIL